MSTEQIGLFPLYRRENKSQQTQSHAVPQPGLTLARANRLLCRWLAHYVFWPTWFSRSLAEGGRNSVTTSGQDMAQQAAAVSRPHSTGMDSEYPVRLDSVLLSVLIGFVNLTQTYTHLQGRNLS